MQRYEIIIPCTDWLTTILDKRYCPRLLFLEKLLFHLSLPSFEIRENSRFYLVSISQQWFCVRDLFELQISVTTTRS